MHPGIFRARAAVVYDGWPINAIHNFKYKFERGRADLLGEMMVDVARELDADLTLVPVPLHGDRQAMRGFNQARLLAERIARDTDSVVLDCLMRPKATEAQARSTREERIQQMENAFAPMPGWRADPGQHYVLVDDVYTTGATTNACAHALEEAGARWISVLTFAFDLQHREREAYRKSVTTGTIGQ